MLMISERQSLKGKNLSPYFHGVTLVAPETVALIMAYSKKDSQMLEVTVQYFEEDGSSITKLSKQMKPADFERFLNTFALKVSGESKGEYKLIEFSYYEIRPINDVVMELSREERDSLYYTFAYALASGHTMEKALDALHYNINHTS